MDDRAPALALRTEGVEVTELRDWHVATLRHFDAAAVGARLHELLGGPLPGPLQALRRVRAGAADAAAVADLRLLWRNPTETWLFGPDGGVAAAVQARLDGAADACCIDQTGGIRVLAIAGERLHELLIRLTSTEAIPGAGAALAGRWADVGCVAAAFGPAELLLLVERVYLDHVGGWIAASLQDL